MTILTVYIYFSKKGNSKDTSPIGTPFDVQHKDSHTMDQKRTNQIHTDIDARFSWSALILIARIVYDNRASKKVPCTDALLEGIITENIRATDIGSFVMRRMLVNVLYPWIETSKGTYRFRAETNISVRSEVQSKIRNGRIERTGKSRKTQKKNRDDPSG